MVGTFSQSEPTLFPKLKVHFWASRRVFIPLEGKEAPGEQRVPRLRPDLPWPLPQRGTPVPRSPSVESGARCRMATRQMHVACLERDQLFINDPAKQLVVELHTACQLDTNRGAKPKSSDAKADLIHKRASCKYL